MAVIPIPRTTTQGAKPHNPHAARPLSFQQKMASAARPPFNRSDRDSDDDSAAANDVDGNTVGNTIGRNIPVRATSDAEPEVRKPRILPKPEPIPVITRAAEFRDLFEQRNWLSDGASATMLFAKGVPPGSCPDALNLTLPALVRDMHREYLDAGSHIVSTNTFGANSVRLGAHGLASRMAAINRASLRIARQAAQDAGEREAGKEAFVAGTIGPLGVRLEPLGSLRATAAQAAFKEQALALHGVDLFILETFRDLVELSAAVDGIREAAGPDVIVVAQVSVNDDSTLGDGVPPQVWAAQLDALPADAIGVNCSSGPWAVLQAIQKIAPLTTKPLAAFPSAGLPLAPVSLDTAASLQYPASVEYFASYGPKLIAAGAHMVGGCCGTTPEYIKQLRAVLNASPASSTQPVRAHAGTAVSPEETASIPAVPSPAVSIASKDKSKLGAKLAAAKFITIVEVTPAATGDLSTLVEAAKQCKKAKVDALSLPTAYRGQGNTQVLSHLIQQQAGIETLLYISCRNQNAAGLQSQLLDSAALELNNVLCLTGEDPGRIDVDSIGAVKIASRLNRGLRLGQNSGNNLTGLLLGVAANPFAVDPEREFQRLEAKVRAGAEFAITPPVFDVEAFEAFARRIEPLGLPLVASILPLTGPDHARFLHHELGLPVPDAILQQFAEAGESRDAARVGLEIAADLAARLRPVCAGLRVIAALDRLDGALRIAANKPLGKN